MVVKSVHLKNSEEGKGPYSTKKERVACVPTLTSVWTELVLCDVPSVVAAFTTWPGMEVGAPLPSRHPSLLPALSPPRPAAAAIAEVDYYTAMIAAHHLTELAGLPAATGAGGE